MNREVKFRIWDEKYRRLEYWYNMISHGEHNILLLSQLVDKQKYKLTQFTGLKDKNNKDIYEGDILKFNWTPCELGEAETHIGEVFYDEEIAAFLIDRSGCWNILEILNEEVIGNVFENPELLKNEVV